MLGTHTTLTVSYEFHDEWVNDIVDALLEVKIVIAWNTAIQVKVAIADVPITYSDDRLFLF